MRFGIRTIDEFDVKDRTVLCRIDINQPVDRETGTLKSTARTSWAVVAHTFDPSTWEAEAGEFLSSRLAWSTS